MVNLLNNVYLSVFIHKHKYSAEKPSKKEVMSTGSRTFLTLIFGTFIGYFLSVLLSQSPYQNLISQTEKSSIESMEDSSTTIKVLEDFSVSQKLTSEVRVLCWIMTNPKNHKTKAIHVKRTWGKRCNKILFMSTQNDTELETIALPVGEGRDNLWAKTKEAFKYIYKHHFNDADWFLKADDDT